jgi:hypothetical protein
VAIRALESAEHSVNFTVILLHLHVSIATHNTHPSSLMNGFAHLGHLRMRASDIASSTACRLSSFRSASTSALSVLRQSATDLRMSSGCDPVISSILASSFSSTHRLVTLSASDVPTLLIATPKELLILILNDTSPRAIWTVFQSGKFRVFDLLGLFQAVVEIK